MERVHPIRIIRTQRGFTLIELAIVLVIIGLVVGGVLVGRELIAAAGVRSTVTQFDKYNQAVNTFYGKYGYLPGDIPNPYAAQFGFVTRGSLLGQGDGDGVLQGNWSGSVSPHFLVVGEGAMLWVDLSAARLIEGNFTTASPINLPAQTYTGSGIDLWYPQAKLGNGNYFVAESGDASTGSTYQPAFALGTNFLSLVAPTSIIPTDAHLFSQSGLTVNQAYAIDSKIDDGLPQQGRVIAGGANNGSSDFWAKGGSAGGAYAGNPAYGTATTCYDNNGNSSTMYYSVKQNGGNGVNCALSMRFQ